LLEFNKILPSTVFGKGWKMAHFSALFSLAPPPLELSNILLDAKNQ